MGNEEDVSGFETGTLAMRCIAELHGQHFINIRQLACRSVSVHQYMTRLQILIQFVGEVIRAARTTANPHTIVAKGISRKKVVCLNRLLEPYGNRFSMNHGRANNKIWMLLAGTEPDISRADCETAVRRAVLQTRHM